jgi:hypothetical protein
VPFPIYGAQYDACFDKRLRRHCRGDLVTSETRLGIALQVRAIVHLSTIVGGHLRAPP